MMGPRTIYVDGYNVIRNTPALAQVERGSLAAGRDALLTRLAARYRHTPHRVVVVFDGDGGGESVQPFPGFSRGRVIFTSADETADAAIIRLAAQAHDEGCEVVVVSDDFEVRDGASKQGAATARVGDLQRRMDEAPRLVRKRFTHQLAVKRLQAEQDDDAGSRRQREKGNPRRAPRNRGQQRWKPPI
ncbi:MAG TPA: NYN domain-containing protein [Ktedonobacterales bacterium]|jgi:predicted RNA-binding protein with PIN domain|nr:NYN domain-containing protein [Ktedonobacterales bacterium]